MPADDAKAVYRQKESRLTGNRQRRQIVLVGIIQSSYIPWRGYFDFIASVDLFVILDDVQYPRGRSWRNRNLLKTKDGLRWLTVPVQAKAGRLPIDQVRIARTGRPWQEAHRNLLRDALLPAPFAGVALSLWEEGVSAQEVYLSQLNVRLTKILCNYLGIVTPLVLAREYAATGNKTARLINLLRNVGATSYLTGPSAKGYIDEAIFRESGIGLEYKSYDYPPYPQLWGEFEGAVSILDLIANCGPDSKHLLQSLKPNRVAVP